MNPLLLGALLLVAGGGLIALDRIATRVVRPVARLPDRSVPDLHVAHEDFEIRSGDHRLAAWLLQPAESSSGRPLLLFAHGWGASYGTVLALAEPLVRAGHEVMLFDVRGHGRNEPAPFVTVRGFRDDVLAAVRYAEGRFPGRRIVLIGHSLGGAAVVLATAEGAQVSGLVLIATPSDVIRITSEYLSARGLPGPLMATVLRPFWWARLGGSFLPHTPSRRIGEVDVPVLIIQPEHDRSVTRDHADRLARAAGTEYELVPDRGHTDVLESPVTFRLVDDFMSKL